MKQVLIRILFVVLCLQFLNGATYAQKNLLQSYQH